MKPARIFGNGSLTLPYRITGWLMRLAVGGTFLYSGFTKAIDPWGSLYKVTDYAAAIGVTAPVNLLVAVAFILFTAEFLIGFCLVLGLFRRFTALAVSTVMMFMLPLSLWLALGNPVADCGCFGDALVISNWSTFWKNVFLSLGCVWLLFFNRRLHWAVTPALQWIAALGGAIYVLIIALAGYNIQPLIDFRPYRVGQTLVSYQQEVASEPDITLTYEKNGVKKTFTLDDELPDEEDGWTYVGREETYPPMPRDSVAKELRIYDESGDEDVTESAVATRGEQLVVLMPQLSDINIIDTWPLNSLYAWSREHGVDMMAVAAASPESIEAWRDLSLAEYPIYTAEDTSIKEVARGNPAVMYLRDGRIVWKSTLKSLDVDSFVLGKPDLRLLPIDTSLLLDKATWVLVILTGFLSLLSFLPIITRLLRRSRRKSSSEKES